MNKKILVVVDVQNDFIDGALGNDETKAIVPKLVKKLKKYGKDYDSIYLTRDIHYDNYLDTLVLKNLVEKVSTRMFGKLFRCFANRKSM